MPVTKDFRACIEDRMGTVAEIASKSMFGGVGIFAEGLFMALIVDSHAGLAWPGYATSQQECEA